jgi:mitochondrial fission protein ELM1
LPFVLKRLGWNRLVALPNLLLGATLLGLDEVGRAALVPPWPRVAIAAGRRAAPVLRWLGRRSPATFTVQLMWPGSMRGLDLVVVPAHDGRRHGPAICTVETVPHRLTPERLRAAARTARAQLASLPRPWIACLVGGSSRRVRFTAAQMRDLAARASALARGRGGSLLVTTSRRTGPELEEVLGEALACPHRLHRFSTARANPYEGWLGLADEVVATADSASLVSEACAAGRRVHLFRPPDWRLGRLDRLHARLARLGYLAELGPSPDPGPGPPVELPPLEPAREVAREIGLRLAHLPQVATAG